MDTERIIEAARIHHERWQALIGEPVGDPSTFTLEAVKLLRTMLRDGLEFESWAFVASACALIDELHPLIGVGSQRQ